MGGLVQGSPTRAMTIREIVRIRGIGLPMGENESSFSKCSNLIAVSFSVCRGGIGRAASNRRSIGGILVFFVTIVMHESFHYWYFSLTLCSKLALALACFAIAQDFYKSTDSIFGCGPTSFPAGISTNFLSRIRKTRLFDCVTKAGRRVTSNNLISHSCLQESLFGT